MRIHRAAIVFLMSSTGCDTATAPEAVMVSEGRTPCTSDAECVEWYNSCYDTAKCWHTEDVDATPDIVCDPADYAPPSSACICDGTCVVVSPQTATSP